MNPAIEIDHLTKLYGKREFIRDLCLTVPVGTIFCLLGRNGVGKTTTLRILLGLEDPTRGRTKVFGEDSRSLCPATRARIGYLPEGHHVYNWMTVKECGQFKSGFFPKWNQDIFQSVLTHFGLTAKMSARGLSRGQRAGLGLALTLAQEPDLLVLDDPALGLDPVARRSLLQSMLHVSRQQDRTILFSSHLLGDVERVADQIGVLDGGRLRAHCSVDTFRQQLRHYVLTFQNSPPTVPDFPGLLQSFRAENRLTVTVANPTDDLEARLMTLHPVSMEPAQMTLDDAFITYVGERGEKTFFMNGKEKQ